MTWEEHNERMPEVINNSIREITDIECPKCGKLLWKRTDVVLTTYPPKYRYECECGWSGVSY